MRELVTAQLFLRSLLTSLSQKFTLAFQAHFTSLKLLSNLSFSKPILLLSIFEAFCELFIVYCLTLLSSSQESINSFGETLSYILVILLFVLVFLLRWLSRLRLHYNLSKFERKLSSRIILTMLARVNISSNIVNSLSISLLTTGVSTYVGRGIVAFLGFINALFMSIGFLSLVLLKSGPNSLYIIPLLIIYIIAVNTNRISMKKRAKGIAKGMESSINMINEINNNRKDILLYDCVENMIDKYDQNSAHWRNNAWLSTAESIIPKYTLEFLIFISLVFLTYASSNTMVNPSEFAVIGVLYYKLANSLGTLSRSFAIVQSSSILGEQISELVVR